MRSVRSQLQVNLSRAYREGYGSSSADLFAKSEASKRFPNRGTCLVPCLRPFDLGAIGFPWRMTVDRSQVASWDTRHIKYLAYKM
jgi:hypothetical protein